MLFKVLEEKAVLLQQQLEQATTLQELEALAKKISLWGAETRVAITLKQFQEHIVGRLLCA